MENRIMNSTKIFAAGIALAALVYLGLTAWYGGSGQRLTDDEIEFYISQIEAQGQLPGGRHDLTALRTFLETDDGLPIYTVNMYKFNELADYPTGVVAGGSGVDAYDRFAEVMVPLMLARGSHPVFGSTWTSPVFSDWDRVVVARYRSRRDLVDLFATDEFADASMHKWASIRELDRMIVQSVHIPDGRLLFALLALFLGFVIFIVGQLLHNRGIRHPDRTV
jgi:hypothetical protein